MSYVNCSEWVWREGCTLVYRPWPTSWLSRPDKFGRRNIIVQRLGHVDKADCLSLLASVCVCLNIAYAGLSSYFSFLLFLFFFFLFLFHLLLLPLLLLIFLFLHFYFLFLLSSSPLVLFLLFSLSSSSSPCLPIALPSCSYSSFAFSSSSSSSLLLSYPLTNGEIEKVSSQLIHCSCKKKGAWQDVAVSKLALFVQLYASVMENDGETDDAKCNRHC